MVDERDRHAKDLDADLALAQPRMEALMAIADKLDAERDALRIALEPKVLAAQNAMHAGDYLAAAALLDEIAAAYRSGCFIGEADAWLRRATDARSAHRLAKRRAKKGWDRR